MMASRVGTNSGHGHAWARPDGMKARCGGPRMCADCATDLALALGPEGDGPGAMIASGAPTAPAGRMTPERLDEIQAFADKLRSYTEEDHPGCVSDEAATIYDLLAELARLQAPAAGEVGDWICKLNAFDVGNPDTWIDENWGPQVADLLRRLSSALAEREKERDEAQRVAQVRLRHHEEAVNRAAQAFRENDKLKASLSDAREKALEDLNEADNLRKVQLRNALAGLRCAVSIFDGLKMVGSNVLVVKHALREAETYYADEGTRALSHPTEEGS